MKVSNSLRIPVLVPVLVLVLVLFSSPLLAQPEWSQEEYEAHNLRAEIALHPGNQDLILQLALISDVISEIEDGLAMDKAQQGAVSCHLAYVELHNKHFDQVEKALKKANNAGCRSDLFYQIYIELWDYKAPSAEQRLAIIDEGLAARQGDYLLHMERAKVLMEMHQPEEAERSFDRSISSEPLLLPNEIQSWLYLCHQESEAVCRHWLEKYPLMSPKPNYGMLAHFYLTWYHDLSTAELFIKKQFEQDSLQLGAGHFMYNLPTQMEYGFLLYEQGKSLAAYDVWLKMAEYFSGQYQLCYFNMYERKLILDEWPGEFISDTNPNINYSGLIFGKRIEQLRLQHPNDLFLPFFQNLLDFRLANPQQPKSMDGFVMAHEALNHVPESLEHRQVVDYLASWIYLYMGDTGYANTYFSIAEQESYRPVFYYELARKLNR